MNNKRIEEHIANAIEVVTPNLFDTISNTVITKHKIQEANAIHKKAKTPEKLVMRLIAVSAACIILLLGINYSNNRIDSTIYLDVNPSIVITTNKEGKVLGTRGLNEDAYNIIDEIDTNNMDLETVVKTIIESMAKNSYISETENAILLSVSNKDEKRAKETKESLSLYISDSFIKSNINAVVYDQQVVVTEQLEKLASQYGISIGKAEFLTKLIKKNSGFDMNQLAVMKIQEIVELADSHNINLHDITNLEDDKKELGKNNESKQDTNSSETNISSDNTKDNTKEKTLIENSEIKINKESNTDNATNKNNEKKVNEENDTEDITNEVDETKTNDEKQGEDNTNENYEEEANEDSNSYNDGEASDDEMETNESDDAGASEEIDSYENNNDHIKNTDEEVQDDTQNDERAKDNNEED